ncbi:hypothetical protein HDV03_003539 [Kappamyces sp. JEL0829]|nr:hypothetical protein HDV03_003539 [Kappamyces sp. JEL0829]
MMLKDAYSKEALVTQYRNFEMIEHFLTHPKTLSTQLIFYLSAPTRNTLIASYYRIDPRDLDDIAARTHRSVILCRRVFDNMKRITKRVEDAEEDMVQVIMSHFLLSRDLAAQYAHIIFINHYRLDTTKRKLSYLSFADYEYAASVFLQFFTASSASAMEELDSVIVEDSRLLKTALFNHKDVLEKLRLALLQHLDRPGYGEKFALSSFKLVVRNVLAIGASLSNGKEVRDLFLTIMERIVEPCASFGWSDGDLDVFMVGLVEVYSKSVDLGISHSINARHSRTFTRLFTAVKLASIRFMKKPAAATSV